MVVTVELTCLLFLNILPFNFVPTPNKSLRFTRFRKSYVYRPAVVLIKGTLLSWLIISSHIIVIWIVNNASQALTTIVNNFQNYMIPNIIFFCTHYFLFGNLHSRQHLLLFHFWFELHLLPRDLPFYYFIIFLLSSLFIVDLNYYNLS